MSKQNIAIATPHMKQWTRQALETDNLPAKMLNYIFLTMHEFVLIEALSKIC